MGIQIEELESATFNLNEPKAVYYSGQLITGNFNFELNSPLKFFAINVQYIGECTVLWMEEQIERYNGVKQKRQIRYEAREEYFNVIQCLSGGQGGLSLLRTGHHSIPFTYQLPSRVPSSFKGEKGSVSYRIIVTVLMEGYNKQEVVKNIDVICPTDLNEGGEQIKRPLVLQFEDVSSCNCFCVTRPLSVQVKLPAAGFCPGQTVPIAVQVQNKTNLEIKKMVFEISTKERYRSQRPVSAYIPPEEVLVAVERGPIFAKTSKEFLWEMKIPDFIAPNLENCNIIDAGFFFKARIEMSGCMEDMYSEEEIWLGLVPLGASGVAAHPLKESLPAAGLPAASPPPPYEAPPPSYAPPPPSYSAPEARVGVPGPVPLPIFPSVANVADRSLAYGSKSTPLGPFEVGFRLPSDALPPGRPGYPEAEDRFRPRPDSNPCPVPSLNPPYPIQSDTGRYSPRPTAPPPP